MCKTLCKGTGAEVFSSDCIKLQNIIMLAVVPHGPEKCQVFQKFRGAVEEREVS